MKKEKKNKKKSCVLERDDRSNLTSPRYYRMTSEFEDDGTIRLIFFFNISTISEVYNGYRPEFGDPYSLEQRNRPEGFKILMSGLGETDRMKKEN